MFISWCESSIAQRAPGPRPVLLVAVFCSAAACCTVPGAVPIAPHLQPAACSAQGLERTRITPRVKDSPICDAARNAQFWSWDTAKTTTACTSDDEIDKRSNDTFFIFVQMNPHAVCKLRNNSTSNTLTLLECKADYESIKLNWIIDHFFPWHGVYGLRPCKYKLPCPFDCDEQLCPPFTAGKYEDELTEYWRDPIYSNQLFRWQSEWSHVQPCFQLAQGKPSSSSPSVVYAGEMLNLYKSYNIAARLANHNITPSDTKTYSLVDIKNALNSTVPILGCRLDNIQECVLTRIGLCFNYTNLTPTLIDCPELSSDHHERRPPWILLDYTFEYYTEEGFVCSSNALCTNVTYYGYGHD